MRNWLLFILFINIAFEVLATEPPPMGAREFDFKNSKYSLVLDDKINTPGLYNKDKLVYGIEPFYGYHFDLSPDGKYLLSYNDWSYSMDHIAVRVFENGKLLYELRDDVLVPLHDEIVETFPGCFWAEHVDWEEMKYFMVSNFGDAIVVDVKTGEFYIKFHTNAKYIRMFLFALVILAALFLVKKILFKGARV